MENVFGQWAQVFTGVDVGMLAGIGVISFFLTRALSVPASRALLIPVVLGALYGIGDAIAKLTEGYTIAQAISAAFKGCIMSGAGGGLLGRIVAQRIETWWPSAGGQLNAVAADTAAKILEVAQATGKPVDEVAAQVIVPRPPSSVPNR